MVLSKDRLGRFIRTPSLSPKSILDDSMENGEPRDGSEMTEERRPIVNYAASIEKVRDCGWYWGPIPGTLAERLLVNEPDGSFLVRDSSDEHHIFSLSFKLNSEVRHVRIEHHGGNFSFGFGNKFYSKTIIDFVENAVCHSRSGRFLFFLNRRPMLGPMRVQLLYPVSRFKRMPSLQHLCRLAIFKNLRQRRDLICELPLPSKLKDYLDTPHYLVDMAPTEFLSGPTSMTPTPPENQDAPIDANSSLN